MELEVEYSVLKGAKKATPHLDMALAGNRVQPHTIFGMLLMSPVLDIETKVVKKVKLHHFRPSMHK